MDTFKRLKRSNLSAALVSATCLMATDVYSAALEEVMVTARKRVESLQQTPVSIMAYGAEALERQNVADLKGLDAKLPNVGIGGSGGLGGSNAAFFVRGIGTARNAVNQESAVALYVDESYIGRSDGALLSVVDVEKIEVLRGPQGTLFGRSATAGAIRYITAKPDYEEFSGKVQLALGSDERRDLKAVVNIPLSDNAAIRVMGASLNQDGHVKGVFTGVDYGDTNTDMARVKLGWEISDTVELTASIDHTSMDTNGGASVLLATAETTPGGPPIIDTEAAAGFDARSLPTGDYDVSYATGNNFYDSDNTGANISVKWDIDEDIVFKSTTTYREIDIKGAYDADGTHASLFQQDFVRAIETYSQEFQLSGNTENLEWVGGVFFYDEEATDHRIVGGGTNSSDVSNTRVLNPYKVESVGVFAQGTYDLAADWSVTTGLRYTRDEKSIDANELRQDNLTEKVDTVSREESWGAASGRLSLEYQFNDDVFLFGSFARGFRSGGFNDRIRTNLPDNFFGITDFDEETLDMFELGLRSELFDNQLRFNVTAFYGEFTDMQISVPIFTNGVQTNRTAVDNAGESRIQGVEIETMWAVNDYVTIDATMGVLDAEYTELDEGSSVTTDSDFARAPDLSYSLGVELDLDTWVARMDYGWKDDQRLTVSDAVGLEQKSYGLLSFNVTYSPEDKNWSLSVFGNNLTDEEYLVSGLNFSGAPPAITQGEPGRFREYGVKLNWEF